MKRLIFGLLFVVVTISRAATGQITATVESMASIAGSKTSGTFTAGEALVQTTSLATAVFNAQDTAFMTVYEIHGSPNNSGTWVGQSSAAIWTPTAVPAGLAVYARLSIEGFTTGATYAFGYDGTTNNVSAATPYITWVSKGFDSAGSATTTTGSAYLSRVLRVPGTASTLDEVGSNPMVVRCALTDVIYVKDNTGGGNSGTAPTFTAPAGFVVNTGGGSQSSLVASAAACTNNSILAYYAPRGQWDMTPVMLRMTGDTRIAFDPQYFHGGYDGIACVRLDADGQSSSVNVNSGYLTTRTKLQRTGSSLYSDAYECTLPITSFTQGEQVKIRARVYPKRGDTAFDTNNQGSDYATQHDSTLTYYCDKTGALQVYAVVDTGAGTGTASTNLATARANPFPTIALAITANADVIYYKNQAHTFGGAGGSPTVFGYWRQVTPDPTDLGGSVMISTGFVNPNSDIRFTGGTIKLEGNLSIFNNTARMIWFDGCTMNANGQTLAASFGDDLLAMFFTNCVFADASKFGLRRSGADIVRYSFDGCDFGTVASGYGIQCWYKFVASKGITVYEDGTLPSGTASTSAGNKLFKNSLLLKCDTGGGTANYGGPLTDIFFIGSTIEGIEMSTPILEIASDTAPQNQDQTIIAHCTIVGQRSNILYNDGPVNNDPILRRYTAVTGVIFGNQEIKSDKFTTANANRVGNWDPYEGTNNYGNFARLSDFPPDFRGILSVQSVSDPLFTDDRSGTTTAGPYHYNSNSGTGGGTYSLGTGSPCFNQLPANVRHERYTMLGTEIPNNGHGASGSWQDPVTTVSVGFWWW